MLKPNGKKAKTNTKTTNTKTSVARALRVWEDDPGTGVEVLLDSRPDPNAAPLAYRFPAPAPEPSGDNTSFAFRYWSAAAALRRGGRLLGAESAVGRMGTWTCAACPAGQG